MIYRFDDCELDEGRRELRRAGKPVELQPKPLALLALLIAERHRVVPKDEILEALWPDVAVTESSLTRAVSLARRAIGDRGERARIRSHARRGYRFVGHASETEEDEGVSPSRADAPLATSSTDPADPFIGRGEAMAVLRDGWQRAAAGFGGIVALSGPAGIGKSRLAETFASALAADGQWIFLARSDEGTAAPAFWLWVQVLRELAQCTDLAARAREIGGLSFDISHRIPELAPEAHEVEHEAGADPDRFMLFDGVSRLLERCSTERPIALVLEDLHLAGTESLALLEHLATRIRDQRLFVIALVRDEQRERGHPLARTLSVLARQEHSRQITLDGFGAAEVDALVRHSTGHAPPREWVDDLLARTDGNPLFLREAIRLILDRGQLDSPGAFARTDLRELPIRVRDLVQQNLERLSPETAAVLDAAAVIGRKFSVPLLATVAGVSREDVLDALDDASASGVVEEDEDRPGSFRFAHPLFQEASVESLRPGKRARLHLATADALEAFHGGDREAILSELAHHHHRALGVGDPARAFELARAAAEQAEAGSAWESAARHFEQALAALDQQPASVAETRMQTLLDLGRAHRAAGARARRREVHAMAMEFARQRSDDDGLARAALGFCDLGEWSALDPEAQERVTDALAVLGSNDDTAATRARLLARQVNNIRANRPKAEPGAREALQLARASGDAAALVESLYTLHFVLAGPDDMDERAALVAEMRDLAPTAGDRDLVVISQLDIAGDRVIAGDLKGARQERERLEAITGPIPHRAALWHAGVHDTGVALMEGRFEDAERGIRECYAIGSRIEHPAAVMCRVGHSILLQREIGGTPERQRETVAADTGTARLGLYSAAMVAAVRAEAGNEARSRAAFERLVDERLPAEPRNIDWLLGVTELASLACRFGDAERGTAVAAAMAPYANLHAAVPILVSYSGPVTRWLGLLALLEGDLARAEDHLEDAYLRAKEMGARPTLARIDADLGALLRRRGQEKAGLERLERARTSAQRLGMAALEARIPEG